MSKCFSRPRPRIKFWGTVGFELVSTENVSGEPPQNLILGRRGAPPYHVCPFIWVWMWDGFALGVVWICPGCALGTPWLCLGGTLGVLWLFELFCVVVAPRTRQIRHPGRYKIRQGSIRMRYLGAFLTPKKPDPGPKESQKVTIFKWVLMVLQAFS